MGLYTTNPIGGVLSSESRKTRPSPNPDSRPMKHRKKILFTALA